MNTRGIVATGRLLTGGNGAAFAPTDEEIRRIVTYWDIIDIPAINGIGQSLSGALKVLAQAGLVVQTPIQMPSPESQTEPQEGLTRINGLTCPEWIDFQREAAARFAEHLNNKTDIHWSYSHAAGGSNADIEAPEVAVLGFYDALPVPGAEVPFEDILEFKDRRRAELLAFRSEMDEIYIEFRELTKVSDISLATTKAHERIERRLIDLNNLMNEGLVAKAIGSMEIYLNLPTSALAAIVTSATAAYTGVTDAKELITIGTIGGIAANALLALSKRRIRKSQRVESKLGDFAYAYDVKRQLRGVN